MTEKELVAKMLDTLVKSRKELANIDLGITKKSLPDLDKIIEHIGAPLMIMVMGEFSTGKSTFINAMVGEEVTAVNATPTTAVITKLCYGTQDKILVHFTDSTEKEYEKMAFKQLTSKTGKEGEEKTHESIEYVERQLPLDMLQYVSIIDSPGLNDINEQNSDTTKKFVNNADTMFFMFSALKPVSKTEIDAMGSLTPRLKPIAIINKMDAFDEEEENKEPEEFLDDIRVKLKDKVQAVVGISAKYALEGKLEKSETKIEIGNLKELEKTVQELVLPNRDKFKLNTLMDELGEWLGTLSFDDIEEVNQKNKEINYEEYIDLKRKIQQSREALSNIAVEIKDYVRDEAKKYNEQALYILAIFYYQGILFTKDDEHAEHYLESAALKSHTRAQAALGGLYWEKKDIKKAKFWLEKAAKQNDKIALSCLGLLYLMDEKTKEINFENGDYKKAIPLFEKAAALNEQFSNYYLFLCYWGGWGVKEDKDKAMEFLQKSVELGYETALVTLGEIIVSRLDDSVSKSNDNLSKAVECFTKAAENGNAKAIYNLGEIYRKYREDNDRDQKAFNYYKKAALLGCDEAQYRLAMYYSNGVGIEKDEEQAFVWYQKSAEQGNVESQNMLGRCYEEGWGVDKDSTRAIEWYKKAAEQGYATAQCNLAICYDNGEGVSQNYKEAFKWFAKAAEQDNSTAQYMLGMCYYYGNGVAKDEEQAFEWYLKAAEQGDEAAQFEVATCFESGTGIKVDSLQAFQWYKKAAEQGNDKAQYRLGYCYETGWGIELDTDKAIYWYKKAAEQGHDNAKTRIFTLETKKHNTEVCVQNVETPFEKYKREAAQGDVDAQYELGVCYYFGEGVAKNDYEALKCYKEAANRGNAKAQYALAGFYAQGRVVTQSIYTALMWYKKAAAQGYKKAEIEITRLQNNKAGQQVNNNPDINRKKNDNETYFERCKREAESGNIEAQYRLGLCYKTGEGTTKDTAKAYTWFQKAAEAGNLDAKYEYALLVDANQGFGWFKEAAEQGHAGAQNMLGRYYAEGWVSMKDDVQAFEWFYKAAEQGLAVAQYNVAVFCLDGRGVMQDDNVACLWFKEAAKQGYEPAKDALKKYFGIYM